MERWKKFACLFLSVALLITLLAGCGNTAPNAPSDSGAEPEESEVPSETPSDSDTEQNESEVPSDTPSDSGTKPEESEVASETPSTTSNFDVEPYESEITSALAVVVCASIGKLDSMVKSDDAFMEYSSLTRDEIGKHTIYVSNSNTSLDEFGVFEADSQINLIKTSKTVADCLADRRDKGAAAIASFPTEEQEKMQNIGITAVGNYMIYCILSPEDSETAQETFKDLIMNGGR